MFFTVGLCRPKIGLSSPARYEHPLFCFTFGLEIGRAPRLMITSLTLNRILFSCSRPLPGIRERDDMMMLIKTMRHDFCAVHALIFGGFYARVSPLMTKTRPRFFRHFVLPLPWLCPTYPDSAERHHHRVANRPV